MEKKMINKIEQKLYDSYDFKSGKCPSCKSENVERMHNMWNLALGVVYYFFDFPFDANYHCNKCNAESK